MGRLKTINVILDLDKGAQLPVRAHDTDAGLGPADTESILDGMG